ncbi:MAG TPA: discoidin domain-containing protein [Verrucomicrobiae bacterium]|nr:discoidin domain-containing protein [Verrucomicrobiae bacterium]
MNKPKNDTALRIRNAFYRKHSMSVTNPRQLMFALGILVLGGLMAQPSHAADAPDTNTTPTVIKLPYLSAVDEAKTFKMQDGYSMELVVGDPIIQEPVAAAFDGNGRMYVAEMRSYMLDINGTNEHAKSSRISMHWSSKHNGVYDKHTVFVDNLLLPRMVLPLDDGVLVNETDSEDIWLYRDTKGTGVADKKELFYAGGKRGGNLEHQQSGLIWDRDNWIYQTVNAYRLRANGTNVLKETTPANGGQWGITQDDYGKLFVVNASDEQGPKDFQVPVIYGGLKVPSEPTQSFMQVWPLVGLADVQGGVSRFRSEDNTLNHITSCAGVEIYRGDRLPEDLKGNMIFGEPVGRLVRRAKIEVKDGITHLINPYDKSEFIRSTDANFRPVNVVTAPDGTLYIVDMYHGIIQESEWTKPGSFLRPKIQKYGLENNVGRGRIWRLRHKDFKPGPQPHMLDASPAKLVTYLTHPNGWWRDTAQKLLVLRDNKSAVPALVSMVQKNSNPLARLDALWTLEGMNAAQPDLVRGALKDADGHVRAAAIRVSESLYKRGDQSLVPDVKSLTNDPDPSVVIQVMLTANYLKWPDSTNMIQAIIASNPSEGVKELGPQIHEPRRTFNRVTSTGERRVLERGEVIYKELCFACHGQNGEGAPLQGGKPGATIAPPFARNKFATDMSDGIISVILKGLKGPVNGKTYDALMVPMENNDDEWVASVASYVRNSFGNSAPIVRPSDVYRVRNAIKEHKEPWTEEELDACVPQVITSHTGWKATASDHSASAPLALDGDINTRFTTDAPQKPGMWYQIELPQTTLITGMRLTAGSSSNDYPRDYKVQLSNDGKSWGEPVSEGRGTRATTEIGFKPAEAKFIRITQTGSVDGLSWSIHELTLYKPGAPIKAGTATPTPANKYD